MPIDDATGDSPKGTSRTTSQQSEATTRLPSTEEQILAVRIGEVTPLTGPIQIVDYDPEWPGLFEREAERIQAALGDRALLIEHAGSTSVPGLAAKPRIDIVLVVANSADSRPDAGNDDGGARPRRCLGLEAGVMVKLYHHIPIGSAAGKNRTITP
jgi:GrpB-like predicted nucleotidyltransferase (UPF0157 family)